MIIIIWFLDYTNTGIPLKGNAQKWKYENLCYAYGGATKNNVDKGHVCGVFMARRQNKNKNKK